mgnify:FL=1
MNFSHNCLINEYTVAPIFIDNKSGGHQWFIEFVKKPISLDLFMQEVDKQIKKINSDYEAKRTDNLILKFPELITIKNNEFYLWLKENQRLGGQNKIPRLSNDRKIADRILDIRKKFSTKTKQNKNN